MRVRVCVVCEEVEVYATDVEELPPPPPSTPPELSPPPLRADGEAFRSDDGLLLLPENDDRLDFLPADSNPLPVPDFLPLPPF